MITLRCVVERITYQNPENGYTVLRAAVKNYQDLVTVVGNLLDVNVGSVLLLQGEWKVDPRYGNQFCAEKWEETLPATVYGIEKYLGSGLIKGVGPRFAKRIVQLFGTDTLSVIEERTDWLLQVPGIGKKRVQMIQESWEKQKEVKNIMLFLQSYNVSTSFAAKIYKAYGNESIPAVKENPYRLADDIWGIGFKTADGLGEKLGFGKDDPLRCRSGILYTLNALADEGHVYAEKEQLLQKAVELLEAKTESVTAALETIETFLILTVTVLDFAIVPRRIRANQFVPDARLSGSPFKQRWQIAFAVGKAIGELKTIIRLDAFPLDAAACVPRRQLAKKIR